MSLVLPPLAKCRDGCGVLRRALDQPAARHCILVGDDFTGLESFRQIGPGSGQGFVGCFPDGEGVDIALDAVGGASFKKSYRSLNSLGRLFLFGASSIATGKKRSIISAVKGMLAMPRFGSIGLMDDNKGVFGFNLGHLWDRIDVSTKHLRQIIELVADGTFTPRVDRSFPFAQAADAHSYIQDRKNFGKVLLIP